MKEYNYEKIQDILQPVFDFMTTEYPNGYTLVIDSYSAQIEHTSCDMIISSKDADKALRKRGKLLVETLRNMGEQENGGQDRWGE